MNTTNTIPDRPISADALAGTVAKAIEAYMSADRRSFATKEPRAVKANAKKVEGLSAKLAAAENMAAFLPSGGPLGALFHIHLLNGLIVDLDHGDEPSPEFEAATRILYSLRDWIEATSGASADQVGGEFYMSEKFNPNHALQSALAA